MDNGEIVVIDTPEALKRSVGRDRVSISTDDDQAAMGVLAERFDLEPTISEGTITFFVAKGEQFVPRLFAEPDLTINSVHVARPTLDDVFMAYTGRTIRDAEASGTERNRSNPWMRSGGRR
jgi:ABC-2 type transport system ATP-binding protein